MEVEVLVLMHSLPSGSNRLLWRTALSIDVTLL